MWNIILANKIITNLRLTVERDKSHTKMINGYKIHTSCNTSPNYAIMEKTHKKILRKKNSFL